MDAERRRDRAITPPSAEIVPYHLLPLQRKGFPICPYYAIRAHFRNPGPPERCRCENGLQYAGPLWCRIHPPHLHPRHPADAEPGGGDYGEFYGEGHVGQKKQRKKPGRKAELPAWHSLSLSGHFGVWVTVWVSPVDPHSDPNKFKQNCNKNSRNRRISGVFWSCWADSNCRPHPYQGCALPTELQQQIWRPGTGSNRRPLA